MHQTENLPYWLTNLPLCFGRISNRPKGHDRSSLRKKVVPKSQLFINEVKLQRYNSWGEGITPISRVNFSTPVKPFYFFRAIWHWGYPFIFSIYYRRLGGLYAQLVINFNKMLGFVVFHPQLGTKSMERWGIPLNDLVLMVIWYKKAVFSIQELNWTE